MSFSSFKTTFTTIHEYRQIPHFLTFAFFLANVIMLIMTNKSLMAACLIYKKYRQENNCLVTKYGNIFVMISNALTLFEIKSGGFHANLISNVMAGVHQYYY